MLFMGDATENSIPFIDVFLYFWEESSPSLIHQISRNLDASIA